MPPHGRELLKAGGAVPTGCYLIMDAAYQGDETLRLARQWGYTPVVPPNPQRLAQWEYDWVVYRRRNEIERLFRRLKGCGCVFSRYDKLDVLFSGFIVLALILEAPRASVNTLSGRSSSILLWNDWNCSTCPPCPFLEDSLATILRPLQQDRKPVMITDPRPVLNPAARRTAHNGVGFPPPGLCAGHLHRVSGAGAAWPGPGRKSNLAGPFARRAR